MKLKQAIEHTKNKQGMKVSFSGIMKNRQGATGMRSQLDNHYGIARKAWLNGDLGTVAEFFGLYV